MLDPTEALSPFQLRLASMDDFSFAEALTRNNMNGYYRRHNLVWRADLFLGSWRESENFVLECDGQAIGVMRVTEEDQSLHIRDVQVVEGWRRTGAGTFLLDTAHRWARARGLTETQLMQKGQWSSTAAMAHYLHDDDESKQDAQMKRIKRRARQARQAKGQ